MSVHWELELPGLALQGHEVTWTMKNVGDETAHAGSTIGEMSIAQRADENNPGVDTTPWTHPLLLHRDIEPHTAETMTFPVAWDGQPHGNYVAVMTLGDNVSAEAYFIVDMYGVQHPYQ
jgi:hypothetical protein